MSQQYFSSFSSAISEAKKRIATMDNLINSLDTKLTAVYDSIDEVMIRNAWIRLAVDSAVQGHCIGVSEFHSGLNRCDDALRVAASTLCHMNDGTGSSGAVAAVSSGHSGGSGGTVGGANKIHVDESVGDLLKELSQLGQQIQALSDMIKKASAESGSMGNTEDLIIFQGKTLETAEEVSALATQMANYVNTLSGIFSTYDTLQDKAASRARQI